MDDWKYSFCFSTDRCYLTVKIKLCLDAIYLKVGDGVIATVGSKEILFLVDKVELDLSTETLIVTSCECGYWADRINPVYVLYEFFLSAKFRLATQEEISEAKYKEGLL